jgi:hypothetical protein
MLLVDRRLQPRKWFGELGCEVTSILFCDQLHIYHCYGHGNVVLPKYHVDKNA